MIVELPRHAYDRVQPLFDELQYHLSIAAVIAGTMPGRMLADDVTSPRVVLISSPEGNYLAGATSPDGATLAVARALIEQLRAAESEVGIFAAPAWEQQAGALLSGYRYALAARRRYALQALAGDWQKQLPAGFAVLPLDATIFARSELQEHHIQRWACGNWGSLEAFLGRGFGSIVLHGAEPVSWCLADSAVATRCEVGIHTNPAYRRQGFATIAVAATVARALANGYDEVGWHCGEENRGSQAVAEKVGFSLTDRFHMLALRFEPAG